jgi:hypothetical protein
LYNIGIIIGLYIGNSNVNINRMMVWFYRWRGEYALNRDDIIDKNQLK